ncbi:MAG TPA: HAMP domain-containing sensor histidine kinase [Chitinophagaceae bacterium]|nr:HAMP domain-containing sensor histidine kinase [Chitinophagaceae bacterium]
MGSIENYASFLAVAQHDLDAPLRKVAMMTDLLDTKFIAGKLPEASGYIARIQGALRGMRSMLDALGKLTDCTDPEMMSGSCDLAAIAIEVKKQLDATFGKELDLAIGPLPVVPGRRDQLKELIFQLLHNAVLFHEEGTPVVAGIKEGVITAKECLSLGLDAGRKFHKIIIEDNGIGIPADQLEAIFNPFIRLNGKSEYPGNGLGLSLCKKIARSHQGDIYADGNVSNGSRFILILPAFIN